MAIKKIPRLLIASWWRRGIAIISLKWRKIQIESFGNFWFPTCSHVLLTERNAIHRSLWKNPAVISFRYTSVN